MRELEVLRAQIADEEQELARLEAEEARELGEEARRWRRSPVGGSPRGRAAAAVAARLLELYYALFGKMPYVTKWHPYYTMVRHVTAELAFSRTAPSVLLVSSGGLFGSLFLRECAGRKVTLTVPMALNGDYDHLLDEVGSFDLCLCDLEFEDLLQFREILAKLRPRLREDAKLVLFYENRPAYDLDGLTYRLSRSAFPAVGEAKRQIRRVASWRHRHRRLLGHLVQDPGPAGRYRACFGRLRPCRAAGRVAGGKARCLGLYQAIARA